MAQILVTGGTGTLGRVVVAGLIRAGGQVRVLSRRRRSASDTARVEWTRGDLRRDVGVNEGLKGVSTVIHCATGRGDVDAARNLIAAARANKVDHITYISIVGIDRNPLAYYRAKLEVEGLLEASGLGVTILRATQFHDLIAHGCRVLSRLPVMFVPANTRFQPISVAEVAVRLIELATQAPAGRVADIAGPQVLSATVLAHTYLEATHTRRYVTEVKFPGKVAAAYRLGAHLSPDRAVGGITFAQYLASGVGALSDPSPERVIR